MNIYEQRKILLHEEYLKLFYLETDKSRSFDKLCKFQADKAIERKSIAYEELKQWDVKYNQEHQIIRGKFEKDAREWKKYKNSLEKKHKIEFPVECYNSSTGYTGKYLFSDYFRLRMLGHEA